MAQVLLQPNHPGGFAAKIPKETSNLRQPIIAFALWIQPLAEISSASTPAARRQLYGPRLMD
jgi:hypothetical protein